ncbi:hypothetical protein [Amycolatopsis thailandensis]|nr:hypothetical protein [Amycolatopsis thailandensis]
MPEFSGLLHRFCSILASSSRSRRTAVDFLANMLRQIMEPIQGAAPTTAARPYSQGELVVTAAVISAVDDTLPVAACGIRDLFMVGRVRPER